MAAMWNAPGDLTRACEEFIKQEVSLMFIQQLRSFANDQKKALYLQELYELGKTTDKKHRFQPEIVRKYQYCIRYLVGAGCIETLYSVNALNYEVLKGDKAGISSIRVSKQYRIEFTATSNGVEPIVTVCNILELSNHYK